MLHVVPAVALDYVDQEQRTADHPGFRAGCRASARDDEIGGGHQVRDPVGVAEGAHPRLRRGHGG
jgi:hypothetical protein